MLNVVAHADRALTVGEIVERVGKSQSTVSRHLQVLADAEFVFAEPDGVRTLVRINREVHVCAARRSGADHGRRRELRVGVISSAVLLLAELIVLFLIVSFAVELAQRWLGPERLRAWMGRTARSSRALKGIVVGFITPFCTYSAVPVLVGLRRADVPVAGLRRVHRRRSRPGSCAVRSARIDHRLRRGARCISSWHSSRP